MLYESVEQFIEQASINNLRAAMRLLLKPHTTLVFGTAKTVEHEIAAFEAFKRLGYLSDNADEFEIVDRLRVTKPKARALLYQASLRNYRSEDDKASALRKIIGNGNVIKDGNYFVIEVPDPLLLEDLRRRIREAGFISDGTFSPSLARLQASALSRLIVDLLPTEVRSTVEGNLKKNGFKPHTLQAAIERMIMGVAKKITNDDIVEASRTICHELRDLFYIKWPKLKPFVK